MYPICSHQVFENACTNLCDCAMSVDLAGEVPSPLTRLANLPSHFITGSQHIRT